VFSKEPVVIERPPPVVTAPAPPVPAEPPADLKRGQRVVAIARKHVGAPYRWGGSSPAGFDCSGFVRYVYAQVGVALPHNAAKQYRLGTPVSRDNLETGDLVFFDRLRHNGIYVGGGRFIHSRQTGKQVAIAGLDDEWYAEHFTGARRVPPGSGTD
jgi:cell wall-associated NlpC family hydrolase